MKRRTNPGADIIELHPLQRRPLRTCLVVDASVPTRKAAREILEQMGFVVLEADDGENALAICRCLLPEAILLDWNIPVMDGYEFLGRLLELRGGHQPRVVFCTTEDGVAQKARGPRAGEFLARPFDRDIISTKFREAGLLTFTALPGSTVADLLDSRDGS